MSGKLPVSKNFKTSTQHGDVLIKQHGDILKMVFATEPDATQSAINQKQPQQLVMENLQFLMGILLFIEPPKNILLLGVGAGSMVQFFRHFHPGSYITAVDYDTELIEIAQQQMLLPEADEWLEYVIQDARQYINNCQHQFDLILVDIFDGSQSPDWTRNKEFTSQLKNCLSEHGAVAYNLLINSETAFKTFYQLLRQTFSQQTLCLETEDYENLLLYALNFEPEKRSMMQNLEFAQQLQMKYQLPFSQILSVIYNINPVDSGII
ncbi:MAG: methyltransferase [Gammaproteobacteria bacterium]|nr:methyltransferase [Gammaproteobacteria bacterium]